MEFPWENNTKKDQNNNATLQQQQERQTTNMSSYSPTEKPQQQNQQTFPPQGYGYNNNNANPNTASPSYDVNDNQTLKQQHHHHNQQPVHDAEAISDKQVPQGSPLYSDCSNPEVSRRFVVDGYKDVPFLVAFLINLLVTIIIGIRNFAVGLPNLTDEQLKLQQQQTTPAPSSATTLSPEQVEQNLKDIGEGTATGFIFIIVAIVGMLFLLLKYTSHFIMASISLVVILMLFSGIFVASENVGASVVNFIFAALTGVWFYCIRQRIPLASLMLEYSTRVLTQWPLQLGVAFLSVFAICVYFVLWLGLIIPTLYHIASESINEAQRQRQQEEAGYSAANQYHGNNTSAVSGGDIAFFLYALTSLFWFVQVAQNIVTCVVSGVVATDYFVGGRENMPSSPVFASFIRAVTTSLGSICFGSLLVAIVQTMHFIARSAARNNRNSIVACLAECLLRVFERLLRLFNKFAYVYVATYGQDYLSAARSTFDLIERSGISAIINDDLVRITMSIVTLFDSLIIAGVTCAIYHGNGAVFAIVFLMSLCMHLLIFQCITAGVTTIFVCFAESPEVIDSHKPELRRRIDEAIEMARQSNCGGGCGEREDQIEQGRPNPNNNNNNTRRTAEDVV